MLFEPDKGLVFTTCKQSLINLVSSNLWKTNRRRKTTMRKHTSSHTQRRGKLVYEGECKRQPQVLCNLCWWPWEWVEGPVSPGSQGGASVLALAISWTWTSSSIVTVTVCSPHGFVVIVSWMCSCSSTQAAAAAATGIVTGFFFFLAKQKRPRARNASKKAPPRETQTAITVV